MRIKDKAIIFISAILAGIGTAGCNANASTIAEAAKSTGGWKTIKPSGTTVTRNFNAGQFNECKVCGGFNVTYTASSQGTGNVTVEMPENYEEYISVKSSGGELKIKTQNLDRKNLEMKYVKVSVSAPACKEIDLSGAVTMDITGNYNLGSGLECEVSGASNLTISELKCNGLDIEASGASGVKIGNAKVTSVAELESSGASGIKITGTAKFDTLKAVASGASSIKADNVDATYIEMEASGASNVKIQGRAQKVKKSSSGASSVKFEVK